MSAGSGTCGWLVPLRPHLHARRSRLSPPQRLAALAGITVLDLDLPAVLAVAQQATWTPAHLQHAAQPTVERPDGAIIATIIPERWKGRTGPRPCPRPVSTAAAAIPAQLLEAELRLLASSSAEGRHRRAVTTSTGIN
ncbi:hypothetical protein GCM10010275_69190 [Streptomyces litmocidini]|nr:hypothetical protein GCM10010275_69190 [Streptomyces litmocidini]